MTKRSLLLSVFGGICCIAAVSANLFAAETKAFRPPAVPLVVHDPYFSIWSCADKLTDDWPRHWTGAINALCSMVRIDGKTYRIMGPQPADVPAMKQNGRARAADAHDLRVRGRRRAGDADLHDADVAARSRCAGAAGDVPDVARLATDDEKQHDSVVLLRQLGRDSWSTSRSRRSSGRGRKWQGSSVMRIGSKDQPVLQKAGDDLRIDWGYLYVAAPKARSASMCIAGHEKARQAFAKNGRLPETDDTRMPRAANDDWPVTACVFDLGKVGDKTACRGI